MFKKKYLGLAIVATLAAANAQAFDAESFTINGYVKNETAALTKDGTFNGTTTARDRGDTIKSESSAKFFVNGDVSENASLHAELLLHNDSKAKGSHFQNNDAYTQSEFLRELYIDTTAGDWDVRLGKQQVVWGTADGAKFMDMINPTDYREMAQNAMAESRVPVWMINAEKYLDNGGNIQVLISQPRENVFAGLNRDINTSVRANTATPNNQGLYADVTSNNGHDTGNAFILLGVDSITGEKNGFLNIVPDMGAIADGFNSMFTGTGTNSAAGTEIMATMTTFRVGDFAAYAQANYGGFAAWGVEAASITAMGNYSDMADANFGGTDDGSGVLAMFAASYNTTLMDSYNYADYSSATGKTSVFEYMDNATFKTFWTLAGAKSQYVFDMPKDTDADLSLRYKNSTSNGVNYSLAYSYAYDKNPVINLSWRDESGNQLTQSVTDAACMMNPAQSCYTINLSDGTNTYGGAANGTTIDTPTLRFTQTLERAQNIGASADFAVDTESMGPVVIRAEGVYTKDAYQPIIDLGALSIGDMLNGLKMQKADKFRYVLGADVTVATDMMVSAQFIQERNLDYVDTTSDYYSKNKYTADFASMHLSNGFKKAIKNKEFYSLFFSKPFGASGEGRWNNILMLEEGGGRWNRFDVEYSLTNDLIGTVEYNKYWGDDNSQFGQLEAASNVQVGLKYLFE